MADGQITIECLAETDKFDKEMLKIQKQIDEKDKEKISIQTEIEGYEKQIADWEKLGDKAAEYEIELDRLREKEKMLSEATHQAGGGLVFGDLEQTRSEIADLEGAYQGLISQIGQQEGAYDRASAKIVGLKGKLEESTLEADDLRRKLDMVKLNKQKAGVESFKQSLKETGKEIGNNIKQVGKWAIAIIGVRSAYMMLRQASSTIAQYDQQYAANLEYIRYALAMSIKPILEGIVNLAATLLQYINYIASAWFGITNGIFKSADAFKSAKNSMGGMAKSAKEIKKQLAGFDEMNILQDNSSAGAGGGGATGPSFDLSGIQGEPPAWLKWIGDNKDIILGAIARNCRSNSCC